MQGAIVYFSGTGNTEFVAKNFKDEFQNRNIECVLIDISKKKKINDDYNFYVFGCPIHSDLFPDYFIDFINNNIKYGNRRKCIIFSTQAGNSAAGVDYLGEILNKKDFEITAKIMVKMPQNFFIAGFKKTSQDECEKLKKEAKEYVKFVVESFSEDKKVLNNVSNLRLFFGKAIYKMFKKYALNWAKNKLKVDMSLCVKCKKCVQNCPTKNIIFDETIKFKSQCICCQRCIHGCPVNAFYYKGKRVSQYKI